MRSKRLALSSKQLLERRSIISKIFSQSTFFKRSKNIAFYLPTAGEQDPTEIIELALERGKNCFLPVLNHLYANRLWFVPYTTTSCLYPNKFGILEPEHHPNQRIPTWRLDLVLTPLVAFDKFGSRVGMGGGYYDRTFAFLPHRKVQKKPILIGVAHQFQQTYKINSNSWDIPLSGVVTEQGLQKF